jgi:hypothetical protein
MFMLARMDASATPSTQIWIPSTDIQPFAKPHFGWDVYVNAFGNGLLSDGGITLGLLPFQKVGMEVGIDYKDINGAHWYPFYLNAKLGVPEDAFFKYMPALAVGGYDFGFKRGVTTCNILYGLAAKTVWMLGRFSAGGYRGSIGVDPHALWLDKSGKIEDAGVLASWDRVISEVTDKLWVGVDYQSGTNGYGAISFGAAYLFAPNVSVILGYDIYGNPALKPTVTMQVDINAW